MEINVIAVVVSALAAFFLGYFWYSVILVKPWQKEIGMKEQNKNVQPPNLGQLLIGSLILEIIMAVVLSSLIGKDADLMIGLVKGLVVGIAVALAFGVNYLFEGKTLKLWLINASYNLVVFAVMGMIIGAM
ncbi:MAG: DUF1761 domain-containing protein [Candidatus Dojkabacteria bacterium]